MVYKWLKSALDVCCPPRCLLCDRQTNNRRRVCTACLGELPRVDPACRCCGAAIAAPADHLCGQCLRQTPSFDRVLSLFDYAPPIDQLIAAMKFHQQWHLARVLGELLGDFLANNESDSRPQAVIPVPLHPRRLRERGYNQSLEIARHTTRRLNLPLITDLCVRTKPTAAQSGLSSVARHRNVRAAFRVTPGHGLRYLAILDDVVTTGATVNELSRALKRSGVSVVEVWSVARASRHQ
jgi:ComF family protein